MPSSGTRPHHAPPQSATLPPRVSAQSEAQAARRTVLPSRRCVAVRTRARSGLRRDPLDEHPLCAIVLKKSALLAESQHWVGRARLPSSGRRLRDRDQLGELAEVLGGGGEEELVLGTIRAPQAQAVELQDTLEVGEQHLDLLPLAA